MTKREIKRKFQAYSDRWGTEPVYASVTVRFVGGIEDRRLLKMSLVPEKGDDSDAFLYVDGLEGLLQHTGRDGDYRVLDAEFEPPQQEEDPDEAIAIAFNNKKNNRVVIRTILRSELKNRSVQDYARYKLNDGDPTGQLIVCKPDQLKLDIAL